MRWLVSLEDGIGLYGDRCISEIPQHPPIHMKEEALPVYKKLLLEIYNGPEKTKFTTDLNVLHGKAYEKPCRPQYI